ncbi:helix-turn-helix domain-containing protein [Streptomyces sp. NPDC014779]|uniref:helix-turn-helix domain-containing protein n=1 Tax=Streptomyces sp. NPDC014779 TaxID=3364911 RepID=UPI0037016ACF
MKNKISADRHAFAAWVKQQITARGYDVSGLRSGGRTRFAEDSGISPASVGRLINSGDVKDIKVLSLLAEALRVPLGEVLVRAGILAEEELRAVQNPPPTPHPMTPDEAADALGIDDDLDRELFRNTVDALRRRRRRSGGQAAQN